MRDERFSRLEELAAAHAGRISRSTLLANGVPRTTIDEWLRTGRLGRDHAGAYRLLGAPSSWRGRAHAAVLALAKPALGALAVAGAGAGHLHGLLGCARPPWAVEIVTTRRSRARLAGVELRYDPGLGQHDVVEVDGLPVTDVPRTLVDLAVRPPRPIGDVLVDAVSRGLLDDLDRLSAAMARARRPGGRTRDRRTIGRLDELAIAAEALSATRGRPRSRTEMAARALLLANGFPEPQLNAPVACCGRTYLLDLFWSAVALDLEVDGPHHRWPSQRERDQQRDRHLRDHRGITVVRVPVEVVDAGPTELLRAVDAAWPTS